MVSVASCRRAEVLWVAMLAVSCSACALREYRRGMQERQSENYDLAMGFLRRAVERKPANRTYIAALRETEPAAADDHYGQARRQHKSGNDRMAWFHAQRALEYHRRHPASVLLVSRIARSEDITRRKIQEIRAILREKAWDRAWEQVQDIIDKKESSPEIQGLYDTARWNSYYDHMQFALDHLMLAQYHDYTGQTESLREEKVAVSRGKYQEAKHEFDVAAQRVSQHMLHAHWSDMLARYATAQALTEQAAKLSEAGRHEEAHAKYKDALEQVSDYPPALKGTATALARWMDLEFDKARADERRGTKPRLLRALQEYERIQSLLPGHRDVPARISETKKKLAMIYYDEALYFLGQPRLERIALASRLLEKAASYDSTLPDLAALRARADGLRRIKHRLAVRVSVEGPSYAQDVARGIIAELKRASKVPLLDVDLGGADGIKTRYDLEVVKLDPTGATGAIAYDVLEIACQVTEHDAKKTGLNAPMTVVSEYVGGRDTVPNQEYLVKRAEREFLSGLAVPSYKEQFGALQRDLGVAQQALAAASAKFERIDQAFNSVRTEQDGYARRADEARVRADTAAGQYHEQVRYMEHASNQQAYHQGEANKYRAWAKEAANGGNQDAAAQHEAKARVNDQKAADFGAQARQHAQNAERFKVEHDRHRQEQQGWLQKVQDLIPRINALAQEWKVAKEDMESKAAWVQRAQNESAQCRARIEQSVATIQQLGGYLGRESATLPVDVRKTYQFQRYALQVFGQVEIHGTVRHVLDDAVLSRPRVHKSERRQDTMLQNVHGGDLLGFRNDADDLPDAAAVLAGLDRAALAALAEQTTRFIKDFHETYYQRAVNAERAKHSHEAAECYLRFLELSAGPDPAKAREAQDFLDRFLGENIR